MHNDTSGPRRKRNPQRLSRATGKGALGPRAFGGRSTAPPPPSVGAHDTDPPGDAALPQAPMLPGIKPVLEILESEPQKVDTVFVRKGRRSKDTDRIMDLCRTGKVRFSLLDAAAFARVYAGSSQGVVARLFEAGYLDEDALFAAVMDAPLPLILALDQVKDPGNAGSLARTLYALGGAGLLLPRHNSVYLGGAAAKASAGALALLPVARCSSLGKALEKARSLGIRIYGAAAEPSGESLPVGPSLPARCDLYKDSPQLPAVLVLGGEESGLRPGITRRCDFLTSIAMLRPFDSLNVAQAGAILVHWFAAKIMA